MFVLLFPGVAVQTEAGIPGFSRQISQLHFWTGEMLRGASKGKWRGSFLLWGTWLGVCHLLCMGGLVPKVSCESKMLVEC